ncbi:MAG: type I secretion system permease/ATPase [Burkholderiaceae bacterium]
MSSNKPPLTELRQALEVHRPALKKAFWFSLVTSLLVLAPIVYMFEVYGRVVDSQSLMTLFWLTVLVIWVYIVMETVEWARAELMRGASVQFDQKLAPRVFHAMFDLNRARGTVGQVQPINDLKTVREFFFSPALMAMLEAPTALIFLFIIFMLSPLLGAVSLVAAIVQVGLGILNDKRTQPPILKANRVAIEAQQYADGSLRNAQVIESMGMLGNIHRRWFTKQREFLRLQAIASERAGAFQATTKVLQLGLSSGLLGLSAWLLLKNELAGGPAMMIVASTLGGRILAPMAQLVAQWRSVVNVKDSYGRLDQLLTNVPAREPSMPLPPPKGYLTVEGLVAGAPGSNQPILRGIQFGLQPGEVLAVIGPSASGKTSLARMMVGLWPAMSGKVRLDGADVFLWNKAELGPHMGYLPQGVELFEGSIAENIARFGDIDPEQVTRAAKSMGVHELIMSLPEGYDSSVGRDGETLSGGQRQRVAIARAIYGDPKLVVLDEPNSSLDEAGDAALAQMIAERKALGTTFVVITHRTSILGVVDKILVLRDGQQQAFGPRDEVLQALAQANQAAAGQTAAVAQSSPQAPAVAAAPGGPPTSPPAPAI